MYDQVEVARRTLEEAADRQPWWVRTAYLRGTLWEGAAAGTDIDNYPYSDDDEDSDTSSDEEEDGENCNCDFCVATRML